MTSSSQFVLDHCGREQQVTDQELVCVQLWTRPLAEVAICHCNIPGMGLLLQNRCTPTLLLRQSDHSLLQNLRTHAWRCECIYNPSSACIGTTVSRWLFPRTQVELGYHKSYRFPTDSNWETLAKRLFYRLGLCITWHVSQPVRARFARSAHCPWAHCLPGIRNGVARWTKLLARTVLILPALSPSRLFANIPRFVCIPSETSHSFKLFVHSKLKHSHGRGKGRGTGQSGVAS